jgi:hypothetical protein
VPPYSRISAAAITASNETASRVAMFRGEPERAQAQPDQLDPGPDYGGADLIYPE